MDGKHLVRKTKQNNKITHTHTKSNNKQSQFCLVALEEICYFFHKQHRSIDGIRTCNSATSVKHSTIRVRLPLCGLKPGILFWFIWCNNKLCSVFSCVSSDIFTAFNLAQRCIAKVQAHCPGHKLNLSGMSF